MILIGDWSMIHGMVWLNHKQWDQNLISKLLIFVVTVYYYLLDVSNVVEKYESMCRMLIFLVVGSICQILHKLMYGSIASNWYICIFLNDFNNYFFSIGMYSWIHKKRRRMTVTLVTWLVSLIVYWRLPDTIG